jgi:Fur family transcriptional regulator, ferric uptake regulator
MASDAMTDLRRAFQVIGKRFTTQRQRIWELFAAHQAGLTISEAAERVKGEGVGHTTVYRTVKELTELGFLQWVHDRDGEHRYIAGHGGHSHPLVCRSCGRVQLIDCQGMSTLHKLIAVETGFTVDGHHLEVFGTCPACRDRDR